MSQSSEANILSPFYDICSRFPVIRGNFSTAKLSGLMLWLEMTSRPQNRWLDDIPPTNSSLDSRYTDRTLYRSDNTAAATTVAMIWRWCDDDEAMMTVMIMMNVMMTIMRKLKLNQGKWNAGSSKQRPRPVVASELLHDQRRLFSTALRESITKHHFTLAILTDWHHISVLTQYIKPNANVQTSAGVDGSIKQQQQQLDSTGYSTLPSPLKLMQRAVNMYISSLVDTHTDRQRDAEHHNTFARYDDDDDRRRRRSTTIVDDDDRRRRPSTTTTTTVDDDRRRRRRRPSSTTTTTTTVDDYSTTTFLFNCLKLFQDTVCPKSKPWSKNESSKLENTQSWKFLYVQL